MLSGRSEEAAALRYEQRAELGDAFSLF